VVEHLDADDPTGLDDPARHPLVVPGRLGVTGRMVVGDDDRRGVRQQGVPQDLARGHEGVVERADADGDGLEDAVLGVEHHGDAVLAVRGAEQRHDEARDRLGVVEAVAVGRRHADRAPAPGAVGGTPGRGGRSPVGRRGPRGDGLTARRGDGAGRDGGRGGAWHRRLREGGARASPSR
jgi:hypothetical protein